MEYFYRYIMTPTEFQSWKVDVIAATGLARDALHVYFGLTLFLVARFIFRHRPWSGPVAWLGVVVVAMLGEVLDYSGKGGIIGLLRAEDHFHDLVNTLFWPTALLLFGQVIFAPKASNNVPLADQVAD